MYCPQCGAEYRPGFSRCADCDVDLVTELPRRSDPKLELVKVFETGNAALIPLIESLLHEAEIEFLTKGENLQDLFGIGRVGTGFNTVLGPVQFWVRQEDEEMARRLLLEFEGRPPSSQLPNFPTS